MLSEIHTHEQLSWSNVGHPSTDGQTTLIKKLIIYHFSKVIIILSIEA